MGNCGDIAAGLLGQGNSGNLSLALLPPFLGVGGLVPSWARIAIRLRVPLGFLLAAAYVWFAHPRGLSIAVGSAFILFGLGIRAAASGHIRKNAQLATTGPYAYTRNPLYLGSVVLAAGFIIAARNFWLGIAAAVMFLVIYLPVTLNEEHYLRSAFPEYTQYAEQVRRFWPRLTPYRSTIDRRSPQFSPDLYLRHREYNAVIGSALMLTGLILKLCFF